jgi:hypothetical protein
MKNIKKIKIFSIYTIISFLTLVVIFLFLPGSKKIVTIYEIRNTFKENKINVNFFENFFDFKAADLGINNSELEKIYLDVALWHKSSEYSYSMNILNNFYELFNNNLKNELTLNSLNSQTILKSYSFKNIPERIYEVKIISENPEDAQKFLEKNASKIIEKINNKIFEDIYYDYVNKTFKQTLKEIDEINNQISMLKNCQSNKFTLPTQSCPITYNDDLINKLINNFEFINNTKLDKIKKAKTLDLKVNDIKQNDFLYRNFVKIHKKEHVNNISFLKVFILYLLSLIFVWILIFKENYFIFLFKNKLFKFPK